MSVPRWTRCADCGHTREYHATAWGCLTAGCSCGRFRHATGGAPPTIGKRVTGRRRRLPGVQN